VVASVAVVAVVASVAVVAVVASVGGGVTVKEITVLHNRY
jgi:hypothetical protein